MGDRLDTLVHVGIPCAFSLGTLDGILPLAHVHTAPVLLGTTLYCTRLCNAIGQGFMFVCLFVCYIFEIGFLHSSSCPKTHYVNQAILKLTEFHLPLPPKC